MKEEEMMKNNFTLSNRHETLFLWDVRKSNPNGDPSGNEPRIDRYTKRCDVTDVCIKRSVRDYIGKTKGIDSILITRLGEDVPQIVTLTERITDFLFGSEEKKGKTFQQVEISSGNVLEASRTKLQELEIDITSAKDKDKEKLEKERDAIKKTLEYFEGFKNEKSAEKLKKLIDEREKWPNLINHLRKYMCNCFYDLKMFGSVLAIKSKTPLADLGGPLTGPIQIEVGTSLHKVVQSNKQITSIMAPDKKPAEEGEGIEHGGGLFGDTHCIEYGLFATSAIANENAARFTGLNDEDHALFIKALWRGTRDRHTRSKNQVPRLLIDIEYDKPFHFGDLINCVELSPIERDGKPLDEEAYRSIDDFILNLSKFYQKVESKEGAIKSIKFASNGLITFREFKEKLDCESLKNRVCEILDIDYDPSIEIIVENFSNDAKQAIEKIRGLSYCEPEKKLTITMDSAEDAFNKLIEEPALQEYKEIIQKAYGEVKER